MFRKISSIVTAAVVIFAMLPALAASAAPSSNASLAAGVNVIPGTAQPLSVKVDNTGVPLVGESINWVSVILPNNQGFTTTPAVTAPSGWTATQTSTSSVQRYVFTTTGSGISGGNTLTFPFPANVAAPASDKVGEFRVFVSSDRGATTSRANGALNSTIRTLQLEAFGITAPAGAADGSATSGQAVTFTASVTNRASGAQTVTAATDGGTATQSLASGASAPIAIPVTLKTVGSNTTSRYIATATAAGSEALTRFQDVALQVGPLLALVPQTFEPKRVRSNTGAPAYEFKVAATKRNTPGLTVNSCQLYFDANGVANSFELNAPTTWSANNQQTLVFQSGNVTGVSGNYAPRVGCTGTDGNDAAFVQNPLDNALSLDIDNLAPVITDLALTAPAGQSAVKNSDRVDVSFKIDDVNATIRLAEVRDNFGNKVDITNLSRSGNTYTGRATVNFPLDEGTVFAQIEAIDYVGGNPAGASSNVIDLDNIVPAIADPARTTSTTTIEVLIVDNSAVSGGCNAGHWQVEDNLVTAVRGFDDTEVCGDSVYRVLVLARAIDIDATPAVTYNATGLTAQQTPIRDGAANRALTRTVDTVVGIVPAAPNLVQVTRNGGTETAVFDQDSYWTRFGGNDLMVSFTGAKAGYEAFVVDGNGNDVAGPLPLGGDTDTIVVPIGSTEGAYNRGIQLRNAAGRGDIRSLTVMLDATAPSVSTATNVGQEVTVNFNDIVWAGDNFAADWFGYETTPDGNDAYQPSRVDIRDGNLANRVLTFEFNNSDNFANLVDYLNSGSIRYRDRAGNTLADTLS